jgi:hypothetical protein
LITCLLCCCCLSANAQFFELEEGRKRVTIPFKFIRNLVVIELKVNEKGPFNFVLDTGVGMMIITDPNLADSIAYTNRRTVKISGFGEGEDYEAYLTPPLKIEIPGLVSYGVNTAILKKDHFGLSNYAGVPIHGLLGYEFFNKLSVKLNFGDSTVSVSRAKDMRIFRKAIRLPITIEANKPYLQTNITFADGTEKSAKLVIDLGAGHPLSLENVANKEVLQKKLISANLGMGLNGLISGYIGRIKYLDIGKYKIKDVITSFPNDNNKPTYVPRDGNLGVGILKKFNVIFDYQNNALYLKPGYYYHNTFDHDMSGLGYYAGGEELKHVMIEKVEPESAGEKAGLQKDDEIVSINFKPVGKMTLQQIDDLFKSEDGRSFVLDIFRDKKYHKVIITLKRRI